jgi:hypothetical protein
MWQMQVLDVAIGLFLMYLLFSLVCTAATELLSALFQIRAGMLRDKIKEMLGSASAGRLYEQLFIKPDKRNPSYVKAQDFSLALLEVLSPSAPGSPPRAFLTLRSSVAGEYADAEAKLAGLASARTPAEERLKRDAQARLRSIKAILALVDDSGRDMAKLKESIEHWFDSTMERLTGAYKRNAQVAIFVLGSLIVVGLNADTIAICRKLWTDTALRAALVSAATQVVQPPAGDSLAKTAQTPVAESLASAAGRSAGDSLAKGAPVPTLTQLRKELEGIELPMGWQFERKPAPGQTKPPYRGWSFWLLKVAGWIITALAISLGAPFWFDLLGRLVQVRSALKPRTAAETRNDS